MAEKEGAYDRVLDFYSTPTYEHSEDVLNL